MNPYRIIYLFKYDGLRVKTLDLFLYEDGIDNGVRISVYEYGKLYGTLTLKIV